MADWSKPALASTYANFVDEIKARDTDLAVMFDPEVVTVTNYPNRAVRWRALGRKWEQYNSDTTQWSDLASVYAISIDGNAATATSASSAPWSGITGKPNTVAGYGIGDIQDYIFPSGTKMPFAQASAPVGWTQVTDDSATNRMMRVVNSTGGGSGGTNSPILNDVVPSHTHTATASATNIDHLHAASTDWQGSHSHLIYNSPRYNTGSDNVLDATSGKASAADGVIENRYTEAAGAHTHNVSVGGMNQNASHGHTLSVAANSSAANWTPRYIDMIICRKN